DDGPDLLKHPPCGFVGDPGFPLDLFRGNSATSRGHEVNRIEPEAKRSRGFVVNGIGSRVGVMTAEIATVGRPACYPMMLRYTVALFAKDAIGIEMSLEPFKASRIGREHAVKIADGKILTCGLFWYW